MNSENEARFTLRELLYIIFKHKGKILTIFFTIVMTVTIGSFIATPVYEATSMILVKFGRENIYTPATPTREGSPPVMFDSKRKERINSAVEMIKGRSIIKRVIEDIGVKIIFPNIEKKTLLKRLRELISPKPPVTLLDQATLIFQGKLKVEVIKDTDIFVISFEHPKPEIASKTVNKLVDIFLEHHLSVYKEIQKYSFFDEQVSLLQKKLRDSEVELENFCKMNNITSLQEQKTLLLKQISDLNIELSKTRSEISEQEGKMQALMGYPSAEILLEVKMGQETDFNPSAISAIRQKLAALNLEEEKLLSKYKEENLTVINVRKEIKKAQELLDREEKIYHDKAIVTIGHTLDALRSKELTQEQHLANYQQDLILINSVEMRLKELNRQVEINEDNYHLYVKHMEEARISNAMDTQKIANISVVEPALLPLYPIKPKKILNILISMILGVVLSLCTAFVYEYLSHGFNNAEEVKRHLDLPVLASIPEMK